MKENANDDYQTVNNKILWQRHYFLVCLLKKELYVIRLGDDHIDSSRAHKVINKDTED